MVAAVVPSVPPARQRALSAAVDALLAEDLAGFDADDLAEQLVAQRCESDRLEADFCRRLRVWEELDRARGGTGDSTTMLRCRTRMGAGDVHQRQAVARDLELVPGAAEAFAGGEMTFAHAAALARCVEDNGVAAVAPRAALLLDTARNEDADHFRHATRQIRHMVDPDGALRDAEEAHRRRFFRVTTMHNGRCSLDGMLGDEDASLLRTAIEAFGVAGADDLRSPGQRRADGLVELARRVLQSSTTPSSRGVRPHLMVTVSEATLRRQPGAAAASLRWGGVVPGETARRLACDASVVEVVVGEEGDPLSVGRARRTIPASIRRALEIRDGGCRWPGCGRPAEWTDVHHVRHWVDGGATAVGNLVLLCRRHHRVLHEGGRSWEEVLASVPGGPRTRVDEADMGLASAAADRDGARPARSP